MTGKSHKAIGMAVGVAMATYLVATTGNPLYCMATLTSPMGAMLPDIDHDNSKLGSQRKAITSGIVKAISISVSLAVIGLLIYAYMTQNILAGVIGISTILVIGLFILIAKNPKIQKGLGFFTKHRGIMHTMVLPCLMLCSGFVFQAELINIMFVGTAFGYISHLIADSLTVRGCPLFWPITKKSIHVLNISTGTCWEYIAAFLLSGGVICLALFLIR